MAKLILDQPKLNKNPKLVYSPKEPKLIPDPIESDSLTVRFGKQAYNAAIAAPVKAVGTKSKLGEFNTLMNMSLISREDVRKRFEAGEALTQKEIDWHSAKRGRSFTKAFLGISFFTALR